MPLTEQSPLTLAYICSPYRGEVAYNIQQARNFSRFVAELGHIPIAPHLLFTQFFDDNIIEHRNYAMQLNSSLLDRCESIFVLGPKISTGMHYEVMQALNANIPIYTYLRNESTSSRHLAFIPWTIDIERKVNINGLPEPA